MQRQNSLNWAISDQITADRLQDFNEDLDSLFSKVSNDNLLCTYNILWQLEQLTDNENNITINVDWTDYENDPWTLSIQEVWDLKKYLITYDSVWYIASIEYITA